MKMFRYEDLRNFLLNNARRTKYFKLFLYLKESVSKDKNFNFIEHLTIYKDNIILTAKNEKELRKKTKAYIKNKFKLMKFGILDEIKAKLEDFKKEL